MKGGTETMKYFSTKLYLKSMLEAGLIDSVGVTKSLENWATVFNGFTVDKIISLGFQVHEDDISDHVDTIEEAIEYLDYLLEIKKIRSAQHLVLTQAIKQGLSTLKGVMNSTWTKMMS